MNGHAIFKFLGFVLRENLKLLFPYGQHGSLCVPSRNAVLSGWETRGESAKQADGRPLPPCQFWRIIAKRRDFQKD